MKSWNIEVFVLDEAGNQKPATCFTKVVYNLHPSFANPIQSTLPPLPQWVCTYIIGPRLLTLAGAQHSPRPHSGARMKDGASST